MGCKGLSMNTTRRTALLSVGSILRGMPPRAGSIGSTCSPFLGSSGRASGSSMMTRWDFSAGGKISLKSIHVLFGYVMGANLLWRFIWAFYGNRYASWRAILPGGPGYFASLRAYTASFLSSEPQQFVGHNPIARIGVTLLDLPLI